MSGCIITESKRSGGGVFLLGFFGRLAVLCTVCLCLYPPFLDMVAFVGIFSSSSWCLYPPLFSFGFCTFTGTSTVPYITYIHRYYSYSYLYPFFLRIRTSFGREGGAPIRFFFFFWFVSLSCVLSVSDVSVCPCLYPPPLFFGMDRIYCWKSFVLILVMVYTSPPPRLCLFRFRFFFLYILIFFFTLYVHLQLKGTLPYIPTYLPILHILHIQQLPSIHPSIRIYIN